MTIRRELNRCPWGAVQDIQVLADDVARVSTARHGGILISFERRRAMPAALAAIPTFAGGNWYEEDQDWSIVALAFPDLFPAISVYGAVRSIRQEWFLTPADYPEAARIAALWEVEHAEHFTTGAESYGANGTVISGGRVRDGVRAVVRFERDARHSITSKLGQVWTIDHARSLGASVTVETDAVAA